MRLGVLDVQKRASEEGKLRIQIDRIGLLTVTNLSRACMMG